MSWELLYTLKNEMQSCILCKDLYMCSKSQNIHGNVNNKYQDSSFFGVEKGTVITRGTRGPSVLVISPT